ncbi:MAG: SusC/RagA family TonB-linked outer membrane protein [Mariniphaga sp.]|nr:SusC/RagA family TonB-linked outer membrane protein [Mariniphaga sp.]
MKNIKKTIILVLALFSFSLVYSQEKTIISGRIIDKADKTTIIGANIIEYDSGDRVVSGATTDVNGNFIYEMTDPANTLKVSVIGYAIQTIVVDPSKPIIVELSADDIAIGEVTVTAEAQTSNRLTNVADRDNASTAVKIDLVEMQDAGITSAADALQGRVSGLDIVSASGDPGSGSQLVIRGLSSMSGSEPLIVVDGIPQMRARSNQIDLSSANQEDISNLVNIALQDIKSIEVLKDAASTSIYGSQGADGVLLIETYGGRMGKVQFDYTYKNSVNFQPDPIPMLNGDEYIMLQLEEWHNSRGVFDVPPEIAYDKDYVDFYNYSANTDWLAAVTQNGLIHDHFFKVSGGGEKTRYYTSFSYVDDQGTTINTSSKRFNSRINLDYFLSQKIFFSIKFNYSRNARENNVSISGRNIRSMAYIKAPNMTIWEKDVNGNPTGEYFAPINSYQGGGGSYFNPVAIGNLSRDDRLTNILQNTFILRYRINDLITFNETVSFQYEGYKAKNFIPYNALGTDWLAWTVNKAEENNNINSSIKTESQFLLDNPFKTEDHQFTGMVAWITDQSTSEWINIQSNKLPSVNIQDPAVAGQINWIGNGSGANRNLSLVGNMNYKFKDRYIFNGNYRLDANSAFGINNRWVSFYGVKVGWRFSGESWFSTWDWLGESRLIANFGKAGRQPGNPYARYATYNSTAAGSYIVNPAIAPNSVQLSNLMAESVWSYDIGGDLNLFNDRVYIQGQYYYKVTNDLLFNNYQIPTSSGFGSLAYLNAGQLKNSGWELMVDGNVYNKNDLRISLNFNISHNINEFSELPENFVSERDVAVVNEQFPKRVVEGEPIGSFFGFKYLGVWPNDEAVQATDAEGNILVDGEGVPIPFSFLGTYNFKGGDAIYEDVNHDGKIDLNDVVYIGDTNPDYIGGFGANLRYKNFNFSFNFHYRLGFDIVNGVAMSTEGMRNRNNQSKAVLNRWRVQVDEAEVGMLPRAYMDHPANNLGSDRYVEQGDFMRLNNIKIGYNLDKQLCQKLGIRNANFALSALRLFTITNYSGQDPEVGISSADPFWIGVDNARTPPSKRITFSLSLGF